MPGGPWKPTGRGQSVLSSFVSGMSYVRIKCLQVKCKHLVLSAARERWEKVSPSRGLGEA